jgi:toxin HigB-1
VILSFGDKTTRDIYDGINSRHARRMPREMWERMQRKLDSLNAATALEDLKRPPSNRLERLRGDLADFYSIRVNEQYRIVFQFEAGHCRQVRCTDYH